ncbi:MAG TPA: sigma-54 dependent transcriptional regulator [Terracidiphilus sp.]|nr:sigma-54 dependent transcriptional regulator [Terracidiphilus sp.]
MAKVLIVDDEPGMRRILDVNLRRDGHVIVEAMGSVQAVELLATQDFDVVLTDQKMPDGSGLDVMRAVHEDDPTTSVIFLTAVGTVELAVESMRQGAFDFLAKPFVPEVVRAAVRRASQHTALVRENAVLKSQVRQLVGAEELVGNCRAIQITRDLIARVAGTNCTVLITGETGTGKELVARALHKNSQRSDRPFIAINCAAMTETILESELFGYERGAFTGADKARAGLFEAAHEGTLFLDEIAEMSAPAQAKLLRVLAHGELQRVGSTATRHVDVRVLAATHRNLQERVQSGLFREDLYYRLAVVPIHLPPLRERPEDIEELCGMLCIRIAGEMKITPRALSSAAAAKLKTYFFPGNIRELKNLLERAMILGQGGELQAEDFLLDRGTPEPRASQNEFSIEELAERLPEQLSLRDTLGELERVLIQRALRLTNGVQAEAARRLQLSRSDMGYKVGKYSISALAGGAPAKLDGLVERAR